MCPLMRNFSLLSLEKEGVTGCFGGSASTKNDEFCRNRSVRICVLFSNEVHIPIAIYYIYVCMSDRV